MFGLRLKQGTSPRKEASNGIGVELDVSAPAAATVQAISKRVQQSSREPIRLGRAAKGRSPPVRLTAGVSGLRAAPASCSSAPTPRCWRRSAPVRTCKQPETTRTQLVSISLIDHLPPQLVLLSRSIHLHSACQMSNEQSTQSLDSTYFLQRQQLWLPRARISAARVQETSN